MNTSYHVFLLYLLFFSQKTCAQSFIMNKESFNKTESSIPTDCLLPDGSEGLCVQVFNCPEIEDRYNFNQTALDKLRCGPKNENRQRPQICCEKNKVQFPVSTTTKPTEVCGIHLSSRILGGERTNEKEFPWLARLIRRDSQGELIFSCTGSLITSRVVLTTAHCLIATPLVNIGELYSVVLGEHTTECSSSKQNCLENKKTVMVSNFVVHPGYNMSSKNHDNDIGLIILRDVVSFTHYIRPICLPDTNIDVTEYYIGGWGATENEQTSTVKLKTTLMPFSWEQCAEKYAKINVELTHRQICAGGMKGKDSCHGDSGGPLMVSQDFKWYVVGIVSFGFGCGRQGWPGIYVNVTSYIPWIRQVIQENVSSNTFTIQ